MNKPVIPMILRGKIITDNLIEIPGRSGTITFDTPDAHKYIDQIPLGDPGKMSDLYTISFEDILDFLHEVGEKLDINSNEYMQQARNLTYEAHPLTKPLIDRFYDHAGVMFNRDFVRDMTETDLGIDKLEGWVEEQVMTGPRTRIRCFGTRAIHIAAGNGPAGTALALIRNAITRSDGIVKSPSNDPFTGPAVVQTMAELDPNHPVTKHFSIAYWRGGDEEFEKKLYQPHNVEKIVAWGGFSSMKHVAKYIQPGLEMVAFDPKRSATVIGEETFEDEATMREAAVRLASDFGGNNQIGCSNSRVAYVQTGSDDDGLEKANQFAQMAFDALAKLPGNYSTPAKEYPNELRMKINALRLQDDFYHVIGGQENEGAVVVSQFPEAVDFMPEMEGRTVNIVPIDDVQDFLDACDAYTQTVGVFPESLKEEIKDIMPLYGAQRIVSLGYASNVTIAGPQDAIQPLPRMVKWVVDEICSPEDRPPMWIDQTEA